MTLLAFPSIWDSGAVGGPLEACCKNQMKVEWNCWPSCQVNDDRVDLWNGRRDSRSFWWRLMSVVQLVPRIASPVLWLWLLRLFVLWGVSVLRRLLVGRSVWRTRRWLLTSVINRMFRSVLRSITILVMSWRRFWTGSKWKEGKEDGDELEILFQSIRLSDTD